MLISFITAAALILVDQITKAWVQGSLQAIGDIPLWEGVFHFHYARNTGAAFSFLSGQNVIFIVVATVMMLAIAVFIVLNRKRLHPLLFLSLGLILGGGLGNLIDRVFLGYVVDFLYFRLINFAIFNVADMGLVCGCILMGIYILFLHDKYEKRRKEALLDSEKADR